MKRGQDWLYVGERVRWDLKYRCLHMLAAWMLTESRMAETKAAQAG